MPHCCTHSPTLPLASGSGRIRRNLEDYPHVRSILRAPLSEALLYDGHCDRHTPNWGVAAMNEVRRLQIFQILKVFQELSPAGQRAFLNRARALMPDAALSSTDPDHTEEVGEVDRRHRAQV